MKKIIATLFFVFALSGCDDGDLISEEIDLADAEVEACSATESDILYKMTDRQAMILELVNLNTVLPAVPTLEGSPKIILIGNTTARLVYRVYNGEPVEANICASIQPPTPRVIEEWEATAGNLEITTIALKIPNTTPGFQGGERINELRHAIVVRNVSWSTPANPIIDPIVEFGNYDVAFTAPELNGYTNIANGCANGILFKKNAATAFAIDIDPALLDTTVLNTPKVGLISGNANTVTFLRFPEGTNLNLLTNENFCALLSSSTPSPAPSEVWLGEDGVAGVSGIVEVTTTTVGGVFTHEIRLKNVTLTENDGSLSFKIADDLLYGEYVP
ncbi:membrane lipoprotein lipid attachment site-containing protein [Flavobacterium selenitireducens]|uniref:membrane lipoprotein lipid attachment site-containing protein n=1 Tax=Flavobacterium selenitireducens TaxID=2722704 RepID=UPI00168A7DAF|nr:membrane lipoprotein lipid attachment site-containing protein [Flavobacterium selenitireducens]MBD3581452.1 hypothetical protein [Flavobacterium selenitireducens]